MRASRGGSGASGESRGSIDGPRDERIKDRSERNSDRMEIRFTDSHTSSYSPPKMTEPSASTSTSDAGGVMTVLDAPIQQEAQPAPAPEPKPTIPYSWRTFEPQASFEYITDCDRADEVLAALRPCAFGFDVEWKPAFLKGQPENKVALIQLANNEVIYLLQVSAMQSKFNDYLCERFRALNRDGPEFPENLRVILESGAYTKSGVGIQGGWYQLSAFKLR
jgi:hypothetical protein